MVHEGILAMDDLTDLNLVQFACEHALAWLLNRHNKLPTRLHLREFYRCHSRGDSELAAMSAYARAACGECPAEAPLFLGGSRHAFELATRVYPRDPRAFLGVANDRAWMLPRN